MIMSILKISVSTEQQHRILDAFRYINGAARVRAGLIDFKAYKDQNNPDAFTIIEEWESREDLFRHIRSDEYRAVLAMMDMSSHAPEFRIYSVLPIGGLDLVGKVRGDGEDRWNSEK